MVQTYFRNTTKFESKKNFPTIFGIYRQSLSSLVLQTWYEGGQTDGLGVLTESETWERKLPPM